MERCGLNKVVDEKELQEDKDDPAMVKTMLAGMAFSSLHFMRYGQQNCHSISFCTGS